MNIKFILLNNIKNAVIQTKIPENYINFLQVTSKAKIGHYQINGIMKISKYLNQDIHTLCKKIIIYLLRYKTYEKIQYSKPGFINIFLDKTWLSEQAESKISCYRLGILKTIKPKNIVLDYSSPNMAKEMHVGHLRSTILGDVMARVLDFLGHTVIRVNHIGDWGIQFGMIIAFIQNQTSKIDYKNISLKDLEEIYRKSKKMYTLDPNFQKQSKICFVELQNKNPDYHKIWEKIVQTTLIENNKIYKLLNVTLNNKHIFGESFYVPLLPSMIADLKNKNVAHNHRGNIIIYLDHIKNKDGKKMGVIIQKKDTSFLYSTIDLACLKYRIQTLKAEKIIYYIDTRQTQYLQQIWLIAKQSGYLNKNCILEHHAFGMVLTKDNKPFKTRDGRLIKLNTLLQESINKSRIVLKQKHPNLRSKKILHIAKIIGISVIKYSDLSKNRKTNYIFNWKKMLSFNGNTALYIQYTYTRIQSIINKSKISIHKLKSGISLKHNIEVLLCIKILQFEEIIQTLSINGTPHILCSYLFELSALFAKFYEKYPIIYAKNIRIKHSRLKLSFLIAKTIKIGFKMLGIQVLKYM